MVAFARHNHASLNVLLRRTFARLLKPRLHCALHEGSATYCKNAICFRRSIKGIEKQSNFSRLREIKSSYHGNLFNPCAVHP
jgi:hypothetical protein